MFGNHSQNAADKIAHTSLIGLSVSIETQINRNITTLVILKQKFRWVCVVISLSIFEIIYSIRRKKEGKVPSKLHEFLIFFVFLWFVHRLERRIHTQGIVLYEYLEFV